MLKSSEVIIAHPEIDNFEDFVTQLAKIAKTANERFFQMDVKPDYHDTPDNWEDRLEAAFYSYR